MIGSFYLSEGRILKTLRVILSLKEDKQSKNFFPLYQAKDGQTSHILKLFSGA